MSKEVAIVLICLILAILGGFSTYITGEADHQKWITFLIGFFLGLAFRKE